MLRWQPKKLSRKLCLFAEIIALTFLLHAVVVFFFFVIFKSNNTPFHMEISKTAKKKQIIFVPGRIPVPQTTKKATQTPNAKSSSMIAKKNVAPPAKKIPPKKVTPQKSVAASKPNKSTTLKPAPQKQLVKKAVPRPPVKKAPPPKPVKKPEPIKKEVVKPAEKPKPQTEKKPEPIPVPVKEKENTVENLPLQQAKEEISANADEQVFDEDVVYVPLVLARMYCALQEEISSQWKPPVGLAKDLECQISIELAADGTVLKSAVNESSGVLVYDVAARSAVRKINFPRWAYGKEFTIAFKQ